MFSLFSRAHHHTTSEVVIIFDIGSGSVGAALALVSRSHKPILLATERAEIQFQNTVLARRLQPLMLRALSQTTLSLLAEAAPRAGLTARRLKNVGVLCVLAAPWCESRTKTLSLTQKEPLAITTAVISELVRHAETEDEKPAGSEEARQRFERLLLSSRLNGYETAAPLRKEAYAAAFSFIESRAPRELLRSIENTIAHFIHPLRMQFHSYALAGLTAVRALYPDMSDFLFADIGGEITEVLMVRRRTLRAVFSFPVGRNHLIRALAGATDSPPSAASGLLALAREKNIQAESEQRVASVLRSFGSQWLQDFAAAGAQFGTKPHTPSVVYLSVDADCAELFADFLRNDIPAVSAGGTTPSAVTIVRAETLLPYLATRAGGTTTDSFLMLETIYAGALRAQGGLFA